MSKKYDLVVIGAGPGGMSAAIAGKESGMSVLVLNEQEHVGGQIYHSIENVDEDNKKILGEDYLYGEGLVSEFRKSGVDYISGAAVVDINYDKSVCYTKGADSFHVQAKEVVISAGAQERPVAIPGWTLPGVMGAAAVDVLFKQANVLPEGKVVLAGGGPLLLVVACHLIDNGVKIEAILDSSKFSNYIKSIPFMPGAVSKMDYLIKGLGMLLKIKKAGIPMIKGASELEAVGKDKVEAVRFKKSGQVKEIKTDLLLLHEGVVPNTQLSRSIDAEHEWYEMHRYWRPVIDKWGQCSVDNVSIVGDCSGIYGAKVAEYSGYLAGYNSAFKTGKITESERNIKAAPYFAKKEKENAIRPFIDSVYRTSKDMLIPTNPDTVICRCEEVKLSDITDALADGYKMPTSVKVKTRSGMGRCQGRMCGLTVAEILADKQNTTPVEMGYYSIRSMIKPITLGQLGEMKDEK